MNSIPKPNAKTLAIRMTQGHRMLLTIDLPASAVRNLSYLLPEMLHDTLHAAGVDLKALESRYRDGPLAQGSVLALAMPEQDREVLLYLE